MKTLGTGQALGEDTRGESPAQEQEGGTLSALPGLGNKVLVAAPADSLKSRPRDTDPNSAAL